MFKISKQCEGCGYCAASIRSSFETKIENGWFRAYEKNNMGDSPESSSLMCPLDLPPTLNKVQNRFVAYHKQIERRMDGSAGGVYGALLETVAKEGYYFTGTVYDNELHVKHVISNNADDIVDFLGHKPLQSDLNDIYENVKELLEREEKVLFCGTPLQCLAIKKFVGNKPNLLIIDIIETGAISYDLWKEYITFLENNEHSKVRDIRFYDKEFLDRTARRITFENGRTKFVRKDDYLNFKVCNNNIQLGSGAAQFSSLEERIGDISLGGYIYSEGDGLGYSYVSVNTAKGSELFEKAKRRLDIIESGDEVNLKNVENISNIKLHSSYQGLEANTTKPLKKRIKTIIMFLKLFITSTRLYPVPVFKSLYYNLFNKGVKTDIWNNGFLFITPYCSLRIEKGAIMELHGPMIIGAKRVKSSMLETRLWMQPRSKLIVHEQGMFGYGSNVEIYNDAVLEIGDLFSNSGFTIICGNHIKIGSPVNIAKGCTIRDTNGHMVALMGYRMTRTVELGNHCWICSDSTIMPGVKVGDGSIVGANSYVARNVPSFTLVQGNPAGPMAYPKYFRM